MKKIFQNIIIFSFLVQKFISYPGCPFGYFEQHVHICRVCPNNSKPINSDKREASCKCNEENTFFDKINWECKKCPDGTTYDNSSDGCTCDDEKIHFNYLSFKCLYCPTGYSKYGDGCNCEGEKVKNYFTDECVDCPSDSKFDNSSKTCFCNDEKKAYDYTQNLCVNIINGEKNKQFGYVSCNDGYISYNYTTCLPCPSGTTWDEDENDCICDNKEEYFEETYYKCIKDEDYKCPTEQYFNYNTQKCTSCPKDSTYSTSEDEENCVCEKGKIYDFRKEECVSCEGENSLILDIICQKCPDKSFSQAYAVGPYCECQIGNWNDISEKCEVLGDGEKDGKDENGNGNFIKMYYSSLFFIIFINLL